LNLLDTLVSALDPIRGIQRAQARMALTAIRKYEAAETGRRQSGWKASSSSANHEVLSSLEALRNRSSQMVRDNEYAKKVITTLATKIVGTGIVVIPQLAAERTLWQKWCDGDCDADGQLDLPGLEALAVKTWKERGECLARRRWRKRDDGVTVNMQIQLLEPDHLDHTRTGYSEGGNVIILGKEYDLLGRCVAYWLFPEHPGETLLLRRSLTSKRVPASEVIHLYRKDRISQVRGVPELAVSLMRMRDLKGYEEAELVRKKIEACFTAFVTTDNPRQSVGQLQKEADARITEKLSPGLIKYMTQGEAVTFGTPAAMGGYGEYTATQLHALATGSGITYHQLTGDTSRSSYTSHRAAVREFYDLIDAEQWLTFIPMFMRPVRRWFREAAELDGQQVGSKPDRITTPRKQMVDPLKDTMADKEDIRGGLSTLFEKLRERGIDPDSWIEEKKAEMEALKKAGIVLDTDATVDTLKLLPTDVLAADGNKGNAS